MHQTHSNKNVIATNNFLNSELFLNSRTDDHEVKWKWARQSYEVRKV